MNLIKKRSYQKRNKPKNGTPIDRIRSKTAIDGDCWRWTGHTNTGGYGVMYINGRQVELHRAQYVMFKGPTKGLCVLHKCDNRWCINPQHLFLGTKADNAADMKKKKRAARPIGRHNGRCKIKEQDVLTIRKIAATMKPGVGSYTILGRQFGISASTAHAIANGKLWSHIRSS